MAYWLLASAIFLSLVLEGFRLLLKKSLLFKLSELFMLLPLIWGLGLKGSSLFLVYFSLGFGMTFFLRLLYERFARKQYYLLETESLYHNRILYEDLIKGLYELKKAHEVLPASLIFYPNGLLIVDRGLSKTFLEALDENLKESIVGHYLFSRLLGCFYLYIAGYLVLYQGIYLFVLR